MKRAFWITIIILIIIQFINSKLPETAPAGEKDVANVEIVPEEIKAIMMKACYDCHSMETKYPWYSYVVPVKWLVKHDIMEGRHHLNLSNWADYEDLKKIKKLDDLKEEVENIEMPPGNYILMHREAKLNEIEREKLIAWADSTMNSYVN